MIKQFNAIALPTLFLVTTLGGFSTPATAGTLYKWIDENGEIRYSDRLPPNQSKKKHQKLNDQGVVTDTKEDARPAEEIAAELAARREREEKAAEEALLKERQDKQDEVLLLTFSSESELELSRQSRIDVVDSVIELINKSIASTQKKLTVLETNAEQNFTSQGKDVPGGLAQKIEHFERKIENRNAQLEQKLKEKEKINARYDQDLNRFRTLKTGAN